LLAIFLRDYTTTQPILMNFSRTDFSNASLPLPLPVLVFVVLLAAFLSFDSLGARKLANPDEGRYSEIAREMAESGDFVTPRLNGLKYFEKPPLQYWATAIIFKTFGLSEFTARLYTALCGLGCILLMAFVGWRLYDERVGILAALVLLSTPYFAALTEIVTLDMGLTFWTTLSMSGFLLGEAAKTPSGKRNWLMVAWAGAACAVLSKGLIGVVFPAAAVFLYCLVYRDFRLVLRLQWFWGLVVFFAIAAPWFVLVSKENPEFLRFFFIHEHFQRFASEGHRRTEAWWYFFPILFAGFLPWMIALVPACVYSGKHQGNTDGCTSEKSLRPLPFLMIFSVFVLLFFSFSGSKLPAYILPMYPALALVLAVYLRDICAKRLSWLILPIVPIAAYGAWAAWVAPVKRAAGDLARRVLYDEMSAWVVAAALTICAASLIAFILLRISWKWAATFIFSIGTMIGIEMVERGYEKISPLQSGHELAQAIKSKMTPDTRLYAVKTWDQSLPFYLQRTLTMVEYVDEFELGQQQEPQKHVPSVAQFPALWDAPGPAIAVVQPGGIEEMRVLGLNFEVIHRHARRAAIYKK
jgi:4-amino-4-deoxy-L-arabinose transferase-like glycosyltransferase